MATSTAFSPMSNTAVLTPGTTSTEVTLPTAIGAGYEALRVSNRCTQDIFLTFGTSSAVTSVIPIPGTPSGAVHLPANDIEVFLPPVGTTNIAVITAAIATGNVYLLVGEGL